MRKWITAAAVACALVVLWFWPTLASFRHLPAANYAKEYCSCRFVVEAPAAYCAGLLASWVPIGDVREATDEKQISVSAMGITERASWVSPRTGCVLVPLE